jgi:hypothetical protein
MFCWVQNRVAIKIPLVKIPRNKLGMAFVIPRKKVLIPRNSVHLGIAYSEVRNGTEQIPWKNEAILRFGTERNKFCGKMRFGQIIFSVKCTL